MVCFIYSLIANILIHFIDFSCFYARLLWHRRLIITIIIRTIHLTVRFCFNKAFGREFLVLLFKGDYQYWYTTEAPKSSNYFDHYNFGSQYSYDYYNLSGYPIHEDYNQITPDNYYYYYDYQPEPEVYQNLDQNLVKKSDQVVISPHPVSVAVKKFFSGLKSKQLNLGLQFPGNSKVRS